MEFFVRKSSFLRETPCTPWLNSYLSDSFLWMFPAGTVAVFRSGTVVRLKADLLFQSGFTFFGAWAG